MNTKTEIDFEKIIDFVEPNGELLNTDQVINAMKEAVKQARDIILREAADNAEVKKANGDAGIVTYCARCEKECELMEQSESTASDSAKSAIAVLNDVYGKDPRSTDVFYPLSTILEAMEKYASQKDTQIQALTKEVDGLKGHIEHLESQIFTLESTEADQISQLKISGNKMAEALNNITKEIDNQNPTHETIWRIAIEGTKEWEKLNK